MPCYTIRTTTVEWGQQTDTKLLAEAAQKLGYRVLAQTDDTLQTTGWTYNKQAGRITGTNVPSDLNALKREYSNAVVMQASKKYQWLLESQKDKGKERVYQFNKRR